MPGVASIGPGPLPPGDALTAPDREWIQREYVCTVTTRSRRSGQRVLTIVGPPNNAGAAWGEACEMIALRGSDGGRRLADPNGGGDRSQRVQFGAAPSHMGFDEQQDQVENVTGKRAVAAKGPQGGGGRRGEAKDRAVQLGGWRRAGEDRVKHGQEKITETQSKLLREPDEW